MERWRIDEIKLKFPRRDYHIILLCVCVLNSK